VRREDTSAVNTDLTTRPPGFGRAVPVFTVDVEDWFQVNAFGPCVHRDLS